MVGSQTGGLSDFGRERNWSGVDPIFSLGLNSCMGLVR